MRVAAAQINTTIGDFDRNVAKITQYTRRARDRGADLVVFPELTICGYPPRDLLERQDFIQSNLDALEDVKAVAQGIDVVVGYVEPNRQSVGKPARNAAAYLNDGELKSRHFKSLLPSYDVFDEDRYFEPGGKVALTAGDNEFGITVCEDIWNDPDFTRAYDQPKYDRDPFNEAVEQSPELIVNVSASPFVKGKERFRTQMCMNLADKAGVPIVLSNLVGGNDSLLFDGHSVIVNSDGELLAMGERFGEDLIVADIGDRPIEPGFRSELANVYDGLIMGTRDYLDKCGFEQALIGLSGGIDSSMTAAVARDSLGSDNVTGVLMPGEISSESSITDAEALAENLGIRTKTFPIQATFESYLELFEDEFEGLEWDTTEENLQARIRGNILMALSNKYGDIVLSTGNKSEFAVGYSTLYGDLSGGLAVISDVPKTMVYELAKLRNERGHVIPDNVLVKPPSAELSPDQEDQDVLPPYQVMDEIIERYVERRKSRRAIIEAGFDAEVVDDVIRRIDLNEYKRQQAPVGLKVTSKSLGAGRRMPIAQRFDTRSD